MPADDTPAAPESPLAPDLLTPVEIDLPRLPESAGFRELRERIDDEWLRIHPESQPRPDFGDVAEFELKAIDEGRILPIDAQKCGTEFQQAECGAVGKGEGIHVLTMCGPVAEPEEQLEWLGQWPTNPDLAYRHTIDHVERGDAIYTVVIWSV